MPSPVPMLVACMVCGALLSRVTATAPDQRDARQIVLLPHQDRCRTINASTLRFATDTLVSNHTQLAAYLAESNLALTVHNATNVCGTWWCTAKPLVVWNCHGHTGGTTALGDKTSSVFFGHVSPNVALAAFAVASCLNDLRVKYAVLVVCEQQPWLALANELEAKLRPSGLVVRRVITLSPNAKFEEVDAALRVIKAPVKGN
ncbi:hypothetical protein MRX96_053034 [Rhipicephalus microplus]